MIGLGVHVCVYIILYVVYQFFFNYKFDLPQIAEMDFFLAPVLKKTLVTCSIYGVALHML